MFGICAISSNGKVTIFKAIQFNKDTILLEAHETIEFDAALNNIIHNYEFYIIKGINLQFRFSFISMFQNFYTTISVSSRRFGKGGLSRVLEM